MAKKPPTDKPANEKSTMTGRVKRHVRVTGATAGLAARMAGQKFLGMDIDKDVHAKALLQNLGNLKGPLLKVAQLLSTIPNAIPKEYAQELQKLQSSAPPMGWPFVRRRMMVELGRDWEKRFTKFEKTAAAAASLGQVHRAVSLEGVDIACKLQYPDMSSAVEADLGQLKLFLGLFEKYDRSLSTSEIQKEVGDRLREELDYKREAKNAALYNFMLRDEKKVSVPQIIDDLSTERLLTATWLTGTSILDLVKAPQEQRNTIAHNLFKAWYVPLYYYGVIHGDPHPGNYTVRADNGINLLDFGCIRVFPPSFVEGVITLYHSLQKNDLAMSVAAYESWGFQGLKKETIEILNTWARFLYGPVLDNKKRTIGTVPEDKIYGRDTAHEVHQALKKSGGVKIPREFVFMDRAALGLGSVFLRLQAEVNWHDLFNEMIEGFNVDALAKRQKDALKKFDI